MNPPDGDLDPTAGPEVAVLLVSAPWSTPARPAVTVLRELARRWGSAIRPVMLEDADEDALDRLGIETIPTWLRFTRSAQEGSGSPRARFDPGPDPGAALGATPDADFPPNVFRDLPLSDLAGHDVVLEGDWTLTRRRTGALPKHIVDETFGPASDSLS